MGILDPFLHVAPPKQGMAPSGQWQTSDWRKECAAVLDARDGGETQQMTAKQQQMTWCTLMM